MTELFEQEDAEAKAKRATVKGVVMGSPSTMESSATMVATPNGSAALSTPPNPTQKTAAAPPPQPPRMAPMVAVAEGAQKIIQAEVEADSSPWVAKRPADDSPASENRSKRQRKEKKIFDL